VSVILNRAARMLSLSAAILVCETATVFAQPSPAIPPASATAPDPSAQLAWSSEHLQQSTRPEQSSAQFVFGVTNISDSEVVIDHVRPSCSCTVAKLPSQPWHIAPHAGGKIGVSINLLGKAGTVNKTLAVFFADVAVPKTLMITVNMPDMKMMRERNLKLSQADRQAVFKGECAGCHAEPAKTATGKVLYHQVCGICHEAHPRATMVPDLHLIRHPTDYAFWKVMITNGKPGTLMPAFAASQGGPLSDEQIDELAKICARAMPYHPPNPAELNQPQFPPLNGR
jgi:mono/diheme cytochrome c family protein